MNKLFNFVWGLVMWGAFALVAFNVYRAWPWLRSGVF